MADRLNEAFQRLIEGEEESPELDEPKGVQIKAPKEPEVNPEIYRDVESLLFRGFLTVHAQIGEVQFIFKSMNHHEFEHMQWIAGSGSDAKSTSRYESNFIAHGVFMVDGVSVLPNRDEWMPELCATFGALPSLAKTKLVRHLSEVNRRASNAVILTEAYQMEVYSRFRWAQIKGMDLMSTACTGVRGTDSLGLNFGQLVWRALNNYEDLKEAVERDWDHAKFIGGCFVGGKEIRKVQDQDQKRKASEREDRLSRKDKVIRHAVFGESPEERKTEGRVKLVARTVEELSRQLEQDLRGEKDWHDEAVAREEARIIAQKKFQADKLQELVAAQAARPRVLPAYANELVGLTREEVEQHVRRRQLEAQEAAAAVFVPGAMNDGMERIFEKYLQPEDGTYQTGIRSDVRVTDRDTSEVHALPPPRPRGTPFGKR